MATRKRYDGEPPHPKATPELVLEWYQWFLNHTESFSGELGTHLAYLWPAMLQGTFIEVNPGDEIVLLLGAWLVAPNAPIRQYIHVYS